MLFTCSVQWWILLWDAGLVGWQAISQIPSYARTPPLSEFNHIMKYKYSRSVIEPTISKINCAILPRGYQRRKHVEIEKVSKIFLYADGPINVEDVPVSSLRPVPKPPFPNYPNNDDEQGGEPQPSQTYEGPSASGSVGS